MTAGWQRIHVASGDPVYMSWRQGF